jgi:hypothetical protein
LPSYANDHERYNLVPYVVNGSSSLTINTVNPSGDDNIFLAVFATLGTAQVSTDIPEPGTVALLGGGLLALGWAPHRRRQKSRAV